MCSCWSPVAEHLGSAWCGVQRVGKHGRAAIIHGGHHGERTVEVDAHGEFRLHGIATLQGLANGCVLLGHLGQMPGHWRTQLPHAVEMHLGQRDEFPDAGVAADPRDGGMEGIIFLKIVGEAVVGEDDPHLGNVSVQLLGPFGVISSAALRTLSISRARRSTKPSSATVKEMRLTQVPEWA